MNYDTDKFDLGYVDHIYNKLFKNRLSTTTKLLEIGVFDGGSVKYWRDLFQNATIYAVDINKCDNLDNEPNIKHIVGDAYSSNIKDTFDDNSLDIIIDDGPHTPSSFGYLIENYLVKLKSGGLMIIEDILEPAWTLRLIEMLQKHHIPNNYVVCDMRLKQKTAELLSLWSKHLDVLVIERA